MPENIPQFLKALWNAFQNVAQNAVEEENIKLFQGLVHLIMARNWSQTIKAASISHFTVVLVN